MAQVHQWCSEGAGTGRKSPWSGKYCCRKMMLFPKALYLVANFPQIVKNSIFILNFHYKLSKFPCNFMFLVQKCGNINAWFEKFCWKICSNNAFRAIFIRILWKFSKFLRGSGAEPPLDACASGLLRGRPKQVFRPKQNPGYANAHNLFAQN